MRASPEYRLAMLRVMGMRAIAVAPASAWRRDGAASSSPSTGAARSVEVEPHHTLLEILRDDLGLTGTKECCLVGECGACTVLVDGESVDSCLMLGVEADGATVTTVEGLAIGDRLDPLQEAFLETGAAQCGFCIPGQLVVGAGAPRPTSRIPTRAQIEEGLAGNLCRCAGYEQIIEAVAAGGGGRRDAGLAARPPPGPSTSRRCPTPRSRRNERVGPGASATRPPASAGSIG